jgi:hypothetical protein
VVDIMNLVLRIEGITQAEIREGRFLAYNNFNSLKELNLYDFTQFLCSLKEKVFNIVFHNGELVTYLKMLQYVDKLQTKQDKVILDGILKIIKESL